MERLPADLCLKIFCWLDRQNLAVAQQVASYGLEKFFCFKVCKKWKLLASDNNLWLNLFKDRWGIDQATFFAPVNSKSWKDVYEVQDRCDRVGLGLKIIREADDYYLVHQGEIQRYLGSKRQREGENGSILSVKAKLAGDRSPEDEESCQGLLDKILFFIGDLEVASTDAKRARAL